MVFDVDWTQGVDHAWARHRVLVDEASKALAGPDALLVDSEPKSTRSKSARLLAHRDRRSQSSSCTARNVRAPGGARARGEPTARTGRPTEKRISLSTLTRQLVEQIAGEADASRDEPLPAEAAATRPNKSVPVALRFAPEDVAAIEDLAAQLDISMWALLRGRIIAALAGQREESLSSLLGVGHDVADCVTGLLTAAVPRAVGHRRWQWVQAHCPAEEVAALRSAGVSMGEPCSSCSTSTRPGRRLDRARASLWRA